MTADEHTINNLPDVLARWFQRNDAERGRGRAEQSFCVPKADIVTEGYDLSVNRYKELQYAEVEHRPPLEIIAELERIDEEIRAGLAELEGMVGEAGVD